MWQVAGPLEEKMRAANDAVDQKLSTLTKPFEEASAAAAAPAQQPPSTLPSLPLDAQRRCLLPSCCLGSRRDGEVLAYCGR